MQMLLTMVEQAFSIYSKEGSVEIKVAELIDYLNTFTYFFEIFTFTKA